MDTEKFIPPGSEEIKPVGNEENTYEELESVANEIIEITTKYCGGKGTIIK